MLTTTLVNSIGKVCACLPRPILRGTCSVIGTVIYWGLGSRRRISLQALHHSFPERPESWRRAILKESCRRIVEMGMLDLVLGHLPPAKAKQMLQVEIEEEILQFIKTRGTNGVVVCTPHFTLSELLLTLPLHIHALEGKIGVLYRPLDNPRLDQWLHETRSRFGIRPLSRKQGFGDAMRLLREGGAVGVLFDQNAGGKGSIIHFMDRIASSTELPGLLAHRHRAAVVVLWCERTGFFRAKLRMQELPVGQQPIHVTLAANAWLEDYLRSTDERCADWLWLHNRWGSQQSPRRRFSLKKKRLRMSEEDAFDPGKLHRRVTSVWLHLPDSTEAFKDLPEVLKRIREVRPDYALCLASKHSSQSIERIFGGLCDRHLELAEDVRTQHQQIARIAEEYPDLWICLRKDRESLRAARASGAGQRFGIEGVDRKKRYLTHSGPDVSATSWLPFFQTFGLETATQ